MDKKYNYTSNVQLSSLISSLSIKIVGGFENNFYVGQPFTCASHNSSESNNQLKLK